MMTINGHHLLKRWRTIRWQGTLIGLYVDIASSRLVLEASYSNGLIYVDVARLTELGNLLWSESYDSMDEYIRRTPHSVLLKVEP